MPQYGSVALVTVIGFFVQTHAQTRANVACNAQNSAVNRVMTGGSGWQIQMNRDKRNYVEVGNVGSRRVAFIKRVYKPELLAEELKSGFGAGVAVGVKPYRSDDCGPALIRGRGLQKNLEFGKPSEHFKPQTNTKEYDGVWVDGKSVEEVKEWLDSKSTIETPFDRKESPFWPKGKIPGLAPSELFAESTTDNIFGSITAPVAGVIGFALGSVHAVISFYFFGPGARLAQCRQPLLAA